VISRSWMCRFPVLADPITIGTVEGFCTLATGGPLYYREARWPALNTMTRDPGRLTARTFDVLVRPVRHLRPDDRVRTAPQRGVCPVALNRPRRFREPAASFNPSPNHSHGGLRIEDLDIARAAGESLRERRTFARSPHRCSGLQAISWLPLWRSLTRGKGCDARRDSRSGSNGGVRPKSRDVPPSAPAAGPVRLSPGRRPFAAFRTWRRRPLDGAAMWHDYVQHRVRSLTSASPRLRPAHGAPSSRTYVRAASLLATPPA